MEAKMASTEMWLQAGQEEREGWGQGKSEDELRIEVAESHFGNNQNS